MMTILKIVTVPAKGLRQKSKTVPKIDKKIIKLIANMQDTLAIQKDPEGVALAAPQVGKNWRLFVVNYQGFKRVVINPKILAVSKTKQAPTSSRQKKAKVPFEGCLSLPYYYSPIKRANKIKIKYQTVDPETKDLKPQTVTEEFRGFRAQIIQHEIDHLQGKLFVDHSLKQKKPLYEIRGEEIKEVDL